MPPLGKIVAGTVYYKPVFYETGMTRWSMVGSAPEPNPDENLVKFKESFLHKAKKDLAKKGYSLVEAEKNPGTGVFVEVRIAARKNVPMLLASSGATRWYVFHPSLKTPVEIYNWDMGDIFGMGELSDEKVEGIARKTADDFARIFGK